MTMRVNLIHSKLVFFFKKTKHTKKKKVHSNSASELHYSREQCNLPALLACTVQVNCTVHVNIEFYKAVKIRVQNMKLHGTHYN